MSININPFSTRPWWNQYHVTIDQFLRKLFPHTVLVPVPWDTPIASSLAKMIEADTDELPTVTTIIPDHLIMKKMSDSMCHDNCAELLHKGLCNAMVTGYALSPDGAWRHHSWCLDHECNIIETTERRIAYIPVDTVPYH